MSQPCSHFSDRMSLSVNIKRVLIQKDRECDLS